MNNFAQEIANAFHSLGWKVDRITGTATKSYLTGLGFKDALVYVHLRPDAQSAPVSASLTAVYESEGRNILEAMFPTYNLDATATPAEILETLQKLTATITEEVGNSYAGRLAKGKTPLEPIQMLAAKAYADGFDRRYFKEDIADCDDGLLKFLMAELSEKEDCSDRDEALKRVMTAQAQLRRIESALLSMDT
ncbi:hypothetical protein [Comamonas thiooxydans]|uniref:hypothetical protein n=1 Tax=Comamonas thiooxydans TaxID=363952 RepID=UPI000B4194DF|nr:hypothetical protein [Comamonas thiooxydans]